MLQKIFEKGDSQHIDRQSKSTHKYQPACHAKRVNKPKQSIPGRSLHQNSNTVVWKEERMELTPI